MPLQSCVGPREKLGHLGLMTTKEEFLQRHGEVIQRVKRGNPNNHELRVQSVPRNVVCPVYFNEGRVLIDCACGSGVLVDLDWGIACCFECGKTYTADNLRVPSNLAEIDTLLASLPMWDRNYKP